MKPYPAFVLAAKETVMTRNTVVVEATLILRVPTGSVCPKPVVNVKVRSMVPPSFGNVGCVADVVEIEPLIVDCVVDPFGRVETEPHTSQSPAVKEIEVILAGVLVVNETAEPEATLLDNNSPTLPAAALSLVAVAGICPSA